MNPNGTVPSQLIVTTGLFFSIYYSLRKSYTFILICWSAIVPLLATVHATYTTKYDYLQAVGNALMFVQFAMLSFMAANTVEKTELHLFQGQLRMHKTRIISAAQRQKNSNLLDRMFPPAIRDFVERHAAENFPRATVVFADLENFAELTDVLSSVEAIDLLNKIFSFYDSLAETHHLLKVKTTGEVYIAVANIPVESPTAAIDAIRFALDAIHGIQRIAASSALPLRPRFGVNTGFVVAGTLHTSKLTFDIYGDAVNLAHRMMHHGVPGSVQISSNTLRILPLALQRQVMPDTRPPLLVGEKEKEKAETQSLLGTESAASANDDGMSQLSSSVGATPAVPADHGEEQCRHWLVHPRGQIQLKNHGTLEAFIIEEGEQTAPHASGPHALPSVRASSATSRRPRPVEAAAGNVSTGPPRGLVQSPSASTLHGSVRCGSIRGGGSLRDTADLPLSPASTFTPAHFTHVAQASVAPLHSACPSLQSTRISSVASPAGPRDVHWQDNASVAFSMSGCRYQMRRGTGGSVLSFTSCDSKATNITDPSHGSSSENSSNDVDAVFEALQREQGATADLIGTIQSAVTKQLNIERAQLLHKRASGESATQRGGEEGEDNRGREDSFECTPESLIGELHRLQRTQFRQLVRFRDRSVLPLYNWRHHRNTFSMIRLWFLLFWIAWVVSTGYEISLFPDLWYILLITRLALLLPLSFLCLLLTAKKRDPAPPTGQPSRTATASQSTRGTAHLIPSFSPRGDAASGTGAQARHTRIKRGFAPHVHSRMHMLTLAVLACTIMGIFSYCVLGYNSPDTRHKEVFSIHFASDGAMYWFLSPFLPVHSLVFRLILNTIPIFVIPFIYALGSLPPDPFGAVYSIFMYVLVMCYTVATERKTRVAFLQQHHMRDALQVIRAENTRFETLLESTMPSIILRQLRTNPAAISQRVPEATVFFADIVRFTEFCSNVPSVFVVQMLDDLWARFDRICKGNHVTAIMTIGDCYFAGSGVVHREDRQVMNCLQAAIEMLAELKRANKERGLSLSIRVGMSSGVVFSGVLGVTRFTYDVWGPAVAQAKKLEAASAAGRVLVSAEVKKRLPLHVRYRAGPVVHQGETYFIFPSTVLGKPSKRSASSPATPAPPSV